MRNRGPDADKGAQLRWEHLFQQAVAAALNANAPAHAWTRLSLAPPKAPRRPVHAHQSPVRPNAS